MNAEAAARTTVAEARARYFAANGFDERGYAARWVRLQAGPIPIYFPNTRARVRSVRVHDVHHVVTGYATTWTGEAEIGRPLRWRILRRTLLSAWSRPTRRGTTSSSAVA